jgi:membrane-associated phospholipid phosphatase
LLVTWTAITDLGDSALMAPMALIVAVWLLVSRAWRGAVAWLALFGLGALLVVGTKIGYLGWGIGIRSLDFTGISGHAMTATSTLTVAGYLTGDRYSKFVAALGACLGCVLAVMIAISRVVLGFHSPAEAVIGCALGFSIAVATIGMIREYPKVATVPFVFIFALVALVIIVHGKEAPTENLITRMAHYLSGRSIPFTRGGI